MSLSECCRKIIVNDCLALRGKTIDLIQHGYPVRGKQEISFSSTNLAFWLRSENEICAKCHSSIYDSGRLSNNCPVSVFYCFHVFHTKCIEKHQVRNKFEILLVEHRNETFLFFIFRKLVLLVRRVQFLRLNKLIFNENRVNLIIVIRTFLSVLYFVNSDWNVEKQSNTKIYWNSLKTKIND